MKKLIKILFSFLLLTILFSLCGCGAAEAETAKTEEQTEQTEEDADPSAETEQTEPVDAADGSEPVPSLEADPPSDSLQETPEEPFSGEIHSSTGIITDADSDYLTFQTPEGNSYTLTIPDTGVTGNLRAVTIGQIVTLTYAGSLDENHAVLTDVSTSSLVTGIYTEEYAFAIKIINAVREMSVPKLRELINFPLFIDTGTYAGPMNDDVFRNIDSEQVFTKELVERISDYNLFDLEFTRAGFVMGDGGPNITFSVDDEGILGIIGINSTKIPTATVSENSAKESSDQSDSSK